MGEGAVASCLALEQGSCHLSHLPDYVKPALVFRVAAALALTMFLLPAVLLAGGDAAQMLPIGSLYPPLLDVGAPRVEDVLGEGHKVIEQKLNLAGVDEDVLEAQLAPETRVVFKIVPRC